jgi:hypothetical protein
LKIYIIDWSLNPAESEINLNHEEISLRLRDDDLLFKLGQSEKDIIILISEMKLIKHIIINLVNV